MCVSGWVERGHTQTKKTTATESVHSLARCAEKRENRKLTAIQAEDGDGEREGKRQTAVGLRTYARNHMNEEQ